MPEVDVATTILRESAEVYAFLKDIERLPTIARGVKQIRILETYGSDARLTEWVADIGGVIVTWWQKEVLDDALMSLSFAQIKGEYKRFEGSWELRPLAGGTQLRIRFQLDPGVPRWERTTGAIFSRKVAANTWRLLRDIRQALEASSE